MEATVFQNGKEVRMRFRRMFETDGPWMLGEMRLDKLQSAEVARDASTVTTHEQSLSTTTTSATSAAGRAIVGGLVAGPFGAIIGGSGGRQTTSGSSISHQVLNSFVYLDLLFSDGSSAKIIVKDEGAFKLLQMQVGQPEWTLEQIEESKRRAAKRSELVRSKKKKDAELEAEIRPKAALAGWICFVLVVMLCGAFLYVTDADGVLLGFAIIMGLPSAAILGVLAKKVTYAWIKSNR